MLVHVFAREAGTPGGLHERGHGSIMSRAHVSHARRLANCVFLGVVLTELLRDLTLMLRSTDADEAADEDTSCDGQVASAVASWLYVGRAFRNISSSPLT